MLAFPLLYATEALHSRFHGWEGFVETVEVFLIFHLHFSPPSFLQGSGGKWGHQGIPGKDLKAIWLHEREAIVMRSLAAAVFCGNIL